MRALIAALAALALTAAPARADVVIDPAHRTVTTSRLALRFDGADPERIDSVVWTDSAGHATANLAASGGGSCGDAQEFWGQSYGATQGLGPYPVVGGSAGTWSSPAPGQVRIVSQPAAGCGDQIAVTTTYTFSDSGPQASEIRVERRIAFDAHPEAVTGQPGLRVYVPRVPVSTYNRQLYPGPQGDVVAAGACDGCAPYGADRWGGGWFADDSAAGAGLLVLRDPADAPGAELEFDADALSASDNTSIVLPQPAGGWASAVDEVEYLCFYDASSWPAADRRAGAPATLPAGCGPLPSAGPSVAGEQVLGVGDASATVGAVVDPGGSAAAYHAEWGPTAAYGSRGPELPLDGAGARSVAAQLTGLAPGATYHWRIVAGTAAGPDQTVTTRVTPPPAPPPPPAAVITVRPGATTVLSGAASTPAGSPIVAYAWDFSGAGAYSSACGAADPVAAPAYAHAGTYTVGLKVTAANGASSTTSQTVTVSHVPAASGSGVLTGYACGSLVGNALCTHHVVWGAMVADALDNGCFDPVKVHTVDARSLTQAEPSIGVPPDVAAWFAARDAQDWKATGRVLLNGTIFTPRPFAVSVNGKASTLPGFVLIGETTDSLYSPSADAALAPGGGLPATPLARAQQIAAHLPGAPRLARAAQAPADVCTDPASQLASFGDPAAAGLGSNVDGFPLGGSRVSVHVVNGRAIVCTDLTLPALTPCDDDPQGFRLHATLVADQGGLQLQDLHAALGCAIIAGVTFSDVTFDYDANGHHWAAAGTVEAIPGVSLTGEVAFAHGDFVRASVSLGNDALVVPPWQVSKAEIDVEPTQTSGDVRLSLYPEIPVVHASLLDIDGHYELVWGHDPAHFELSGAVSTLGVRFGSGWIRYTPSLHAAVAHADFDVGFLDAFRAHGTFDGSVWSLAPLRFNLEADATLSVLDLVDVGGQVLVSNNGAAGCVELSGFGFHLHVGAWVDWDTGDTGVMWTGCDVGRVRDVPVAQAAQAASGVTVAPGTAYEIVGVDGAGAAPAVTLNGPGGARVDVPATGVVRDARAAVLHAGTTTFAILRAPAAGRWTVAPQAGSAPIARVRAATSLPPVRVRARVTGRGRADVLAYRVRRIPGQTVRFIERGAGWQRALGMATGARGRLRFTPAAIAGRRQVVAIATQSGRPRVELTVARFTAPGPPRLTRPRGLRAVRRGKAIVLRWRPVPGATAYEVRVGPATAVVTRPRYTVRAPRARITIRALSATGRGPAAAMRAGPRDGPARGRRG